TAHMTREPTTGAAVATSGNSRRPGFCDAGGRVIRGAGSVVSGMVHSQANSRRCARLQRWISGIHCSTGGWREKTSDDDEELLADIETGPAPPPVATIRLIPRCDDVVCPDDRAVAREPVLQSDRPALLTEVEVGFRDRLARVEHSDEVVVEVARFRLR